MFLVGAGAIGCEMIKNWAMMGIASGSTPAGECGAESVGLNDRMSIICHATLGGVHRH